MEITSLKMKQGKYSIHRVRDDMGDAGPMLVAIDRYDGNKSMGEMGEIKVGYSVKCGSLFARSFSSQDYWLTTAVTEIYDVNEDKTFARFKTGNSEYIVESF